MPIPITGLYVGLTIIIAIILGMRIGMLRGKSGISILDGGNMEVALKMRQHQNLMETAALTLLAMGVIEMGGASPILLHGLGIKTGLDLNKLVAAGQYISEFLDRKSNSRAGNAMAAKMKASEQALAD